VMQPLLAHFATDAYFIIARQNKYIAPGTLSQATPPSKHECVCAGPIRNVEVGFYAAYFIGVKIISYFSGLQPHTCFGRQGKL